MIKRTSIHTVKRWRQLAICGCAFLLLTASGRARAQNEIVHACSILHALRTHESVSDQPALQAPDTARVQRALDFCDPGKAVVLISDGEKDAFLSAPLRLPRGVTLFLQRGVTLYASLNPADYDLRPGSCAHPEAKDPGCKPFIYAYQAAFSGVAGAGTIDGQGGDTLSGSHNSWWQIRAQSSAPKHEGNAQSSVPDLVASYESQNFSVRGVRLQNAAGDSIAMYKTIGFRAEDLALDAPRGGDGILLSNSPQATIASIDAHVGGAALDVRASILGPTYAVHASGLRVSGGKGIAIGDPIFGKVIGVHVRDAVLDDAGLRFDLRGTRGGAMRDVDLSNLCLRTSGAALQVDSPNGISSNLPASAPVQFRHVIVASRGEIQAGALVQNQSAACSPAPAATLPISWSVDTSMLSHPGTRRHLVVAQNGSGDFRTIGAAVAALPDSGGSIAVRPGVYREVVTIRKPHVRLYGTGSNPTQTVIVFNHTGPLNAGTFNSGTVFVEAPNDSISNLTISNDAGSGHGQAVALAVTADRAAFLKVRLLGAQDTLFAASQFCYGDYGPCVPARQYFRDCYIAGNTDFIFGDAIAVFDRCELHGIPGRVMYTAQGRHTPEQKSGYVFNHCRLTANPHSQSITLGRPWRPYATVVYLHTRMDAPVIPAGWKEWPRLGVPSLPRACYAEYQSTGPGADPAAREPYSHQLTATEAAQWNPRKFLAGDDGWNPTRQR